MGRQNAPLQAFNRGEIGKLALGRVDVDRLRLSAEEMRNWVPHTVGPMSLRPGLAFATPIRGNLRSYDIPFVFSVTERAILEMTAGVMRVVINDQVVTRPVVASTFPAGAMTNPAAWSIASNGGGNAEIGDGAMLLRGQSIGGGVSATASFAMASPGVEHALRINILAGPVTLRVGTQGGGDDLVREASLGTGVHSLTFTTTEPTVFVQFENTSYQTFTVGTVAIEPAGPLELPTPWPEAALPLLRYEQSGDVVFVACLGFKQRRIERRSRRSWSLIDLVVDDGPFQGFPTKDLKLKFSVGLGFGTVTATRPLFRPQQVGSLIRAFTPQYNHAFRIGAAQSFTPPIRVAGVGEDRAVSYTLGGTFVGEWEVQRSFTGEFSGYTKVQEGSGVLTGKITDGFDNSIVWYRIGLRSYTSGMLVAQLFHGGGGRTGIARIQEFISSTEVRVSVLQAVSSDFLTEDWRFGDWSDVVGYPSTVALHDGRLCFAGRDKFWASVSDAYGSFADTIDGSNVGDSSAISRSIGYGPVAIINWLLPLTRLIAGAEGSEISIRSSALDAPITPAGGITIKDCSTQGSARVAAVKCDKRGLFVQRSGQRLYQLAYDVNSQDYEAGNLNRLHPDLFLNNPIVRLAVQRQPDTRIHCLRADGTVAVLTFEPQDQVEAWWRVETDGVVEDLCVLPDAVEDMVYYTVRRTIGGEQVRYRERFARLDQCRGGALNRMADCHIIYQGSPKRTIDGLGHLEGCSVIAWGDGRDLGTFDVIGGQVTLPDPVSAACIGLPYQAWFKSSKLAYAAQGGTALNQVKRVVSVGLIMADVHAQGLQYGQDFEVMDDLPLVENGADVEPDAVRNAYDEPMISVPGTWDTDSRLCLTASAPRPVTVMAAVIEVETNG
ncbi:hypothetical protein [Methylobacterium iners]|uniref:Uncharacterized protein n=1 Tax=Methylobacterium iners TaxID=418707 RepID=A0ABQ4RQA5_9HYPH|nr:hypothetical protein [Methylobacterium iners]GJD92934.1 hypothetical protein OCOJLMKI_0117 [Methylobacterium iners]